MIGKQLKDINVMFNEITKKKLMEVYKDITGLDINVFLQTVREDVINKKALAKKEKRKWDTGFESMEYILDKAEEAFDVAISAYKKDNNIDITFEENYDKDGNSIMEFGVTKLITKYTIPVDFTHELTIGDIKKESVEGQSGLSENDLVQIMDKK